MPKKQTKKPKYPKELFVEAIDDAFGLYQTATDVFSGVPDDTETVEVAIYKFDRLAKVKRTVTVE